jgi:hypothetical protein
VVLDVNVGLWGKTLGFFYFLFFLLNRIEEKDRHLPMITMKLKVGRHSEPKSTSLWEHSDKGT